MQNIIPEQFEISYDVLATKKQRFINAAADAALVFIFFLMMLLAIVLLYKFFDIEAPMFWLKHANVLEIYLLYMAVKFVYYLPCEAFFGATLGKFITHTKVLNEQGQKPSFNAVLVRTLSRLIPLEGLSFIGEYSNGWHDQLSGTIVVDIHKFDKEVRYRQHTGVINYSA